MAFDDKYQAGSPPSPVDCQPGVIISSDTERMERVPPGQVRTRKWPVLQAGGVEYLDRDAWTLKVHGLVDSPMEFHLSEFKMLPRVQVFSDFHCVTTWSRLGNLWEGVSSTEILNRVGVHDAAKYVILTGHDNDWTTNLPIKEFRAIDALFADTHDGEPIDDDHGGPVRLVIPRLYAWKSAKWVKSVEFVSEDQAGYWERNGYHMNGDPWTEERFSE